MPRRLRYRIPLPFSEDRLIIRVIKGNNLVKCDTATASDPYVVVIMGEQKLKTHVITDNCNPIWNEELPPLYVKDPNIPITLTVYDKDTFSKDDKMGDAELDIISLQEMSLQGLPNGRTDGKLTKDMTLKLRNVKHGELQIQIEWTSHKAKKP